MNIDPSFDPNFNEMTLDVILHLKKKSNVN